MRAVGLEVSVLSKVLVKVPIRYKVNGLITDPTAGVVTIAFSAPEATPALIDFVAGSWETDNESIPVRHLACCLIGPGGTIVLQVGYYDVWVKITGLGTQIPILRSTHSLQVF